MSNNLAQTKAISKIPSFDELRLRRDELEARVLLITRVGRILSRGLELSGGGYAVRLQPMLDVILAGLAQAMAIAPEPKLSKLDAQNQAQAAYEEAFQSNAARMRISGAEPFAIFSNQTAEISRYDETFEAAAGVDKAWKVALYNADQAKSRLLSLYVLGSLLPQGNSREPSAAEDAYTKASQYFWVQINRFEHHALLFAAMLGGDALKATLTTAMDSRFSADFSVIEYLYPDGKIPGSWQTEEEKQFRASLQAYKDSLE